MALHFAIWLFLGHTKKRGTYLVIRRSRKIYCSHSNLLRFYQNGHLRQDEAVFKNEFKLRRLLQTALCSEFQTAWTKTNQMDDGLSGHIDTDKELKTCNL